MKRIIISHIFKPTSASSNRLMAYAKGFANSGKEVLMLLGCSEDVKKYTLDNRNIKYQIITSNWHSLLIIKMAITARKLYDKNNDVILIYGSPLQCLWLPKFKYNIFYECTEIPFYGRNKTVVNRLKEFVKHHLSLRATGMLVISNSLKDYFCQKGIKNITIINMFVDTTRFKGKPKHKASDNYVAYCGTISSKKDGVDTLIKAFNMFHITHGSYILKIIGEFENRDEEDKLKTLVSHLNLEKSVVFTGRIAPEMMPDILCGARILTLARPDNEQAKYGFPTKLGEYLATGNPVVLTRVGEIDHFLSDGYNCVMAPPDNPEVFARKMMWVADNYDEAKRIGQKGLELTKTAFSSLDQSRKALDFMESVISCSL